jgi:hypothetical protein
VGENAGRIGFLKGNENAGRRGILKGNASALKGGGRDRRERRGLGGLKGRG